MIRRDKIWSLDLTGPQRHFFTFVGVLLRISFFCQNTRISAFLQKKKIFYIWTRKHFFFRTITKSGFKFSFFFVFFQKYKKIIILFRWTVVKTPKKISIEVNWDRFREKGPTNIKFNDIFWNDFSDYCHSCRFYCAFYSTKTKYNGILLNNLLGILVLINLYQIHVGLLGFFCKISKKNRASINICTACYVLCKIRIEKEIKM